VTDALLLDTHILLWLESGDDRLRSKTRGLIDEHWREGGTILVSAVTAWEIAMLADGGRIDLSRPTEDWIKQCLSRPGLDMVPLSWRACVRAYDLRDFEYRDPADRLLIATAVELACTLVTYDERISGYAARGGRQYGLRLAS